LKGKVSFAVFFIGIRRILLWIATAIALLLAAIIIFLQTSYAQNYLAGEVLKYLNKNTRQTAKLTNIKIKWFDLVEIKGFSLLDYQNLEMIRAEDVSVNFSLSTLLEGGNLNFDEIYLQGASLKLRKYRDTLNINLVEFISDLNALNTKPKDTTRVPPQLNIGTIHLDQLSFSYDNQLNDSLPEGKFDYGHFTLEIAGGVIDDFLVWSDTIRADIQSLAARDPVSGLTIENLKSRFELNSNKLALNELVLETPKSYISDHLVLSYSSLADLGNFVNAVDLDINFVDSRIAKADIDLFADIPLSDFTASVSGQISGPIPRLELENIDLEFGRGSRLIGAFDFMGLPIIEETFIDARIKQAYLNNRDLNIFADSIPAQARTLGDLDFKGQFSGFLNDFVANGKFETALGNVSSDLNLKFPKGWENASYSGKLELDHFDIGELISDTVLVGHVNLKGRIDGHGLTAKKATFYLDAELVQSEIYGYNYQKIDATGEFASQYFRGKLDVEDPNCQVKVRGDVDLAKHPEVIKVKSQIDQLDLLALGLSKEPLQVLGNITADLTSLNLDSLEGAIRVDSLDVLWKDKKMYIDSLMVSSHLLQNRREIKAILPDLSAELEGDFYFSQVSKDLSLIITDLADYFNPTKKLDVSHEVEEEYTIDFTLHYEDISSYINLFLQEDLYVSPKGMIEGTYYQRSNATLSLFTEVDSINYNDVGFKGNTLDINLSKDLDSAGIIASVFLNSQRQTWADNPPTSDLAIEAVWFNNKINFNTNISQPANKSSAEVNGELKLYSDRLIFNFLPSRLIAFGDRWYFNPYNKVTFSKSDIDIDRMEIYQNTQSIRLKGHYTDSSATDLNLIFTDFELKALSTLLPVKLGGVLDANFDLNRESIESPYLLNSDIHVGDFDLNDFAVGEVSGKSSWNADRGAIEIDFNVIRAEVNTIDINGYYKPQDTSDDQLNIEARFDKAGLQLLDPFFQDLFSGMGGLASGDIKLTGSLDYPVLNGNSTVENGHFKFDYLGTNYSFDGQLGFDNQSINFNGLNLRDRGNNQASLNGAIHHEGFKDFNVDLTMEAKNFQLLNTSSSDNDLYYGTANASGDVQIKGPLANLLIKAKATTEKGTKLYIPLSGETEVTQKDYISFVDFSDTTRNVDIEEIVRKSISGIRLDFDIDVTPDAYVELIFDIKTGDIIRGRGNGNLNMRLDTNGDFELFGDLTITEGAYNFTIPTIGINKEFNVVPGSTISWYGDPYSGNLKLDATYRQLASFDDFFNNTTAVSQKYPILVVLELQGDMLSPQIGFKIQLQDDQLSPTSDMQRALSQINTDDQELKRQVFSLLILRKFSPKNSYIAGAGGTALQGSVSEFITNQLSYFISQMDENLQIDVDLKSLDQKAFETFQLRLSYTFLDGRLKVSGGGGLNQQAATNGTNTANNFLGDWSIKYLLTKDGHFLVKAFSQTEQIANDQQRENGVSFQYIKSFDDFKELLTKTREEAIKSKPKDISKEKAANDL